MFAISTNREVQIGLKAPVATTSYKVNDKDAKIETSTDMFYTIAEKKEATLNQTFTITNTGKSLLSITKIKVCDDPEATLSELTEEDIETALNYLNGTEEPSEPEVAYADATLNIVVNDADGNELVSTSLVANGVEGETNTFVADDIKSAVEGLELPEGYKLDEASYSDKEVAYGESDSVTFTASKEATEPESTSILDKIISSIIKIFGKIFGRG